LTSGDTITAPAVPTKTGYDGKFDGWYQEATLTNDWDFASDTVTSDITLYAKWRPYALGDDGQGGGKIFYRSETGFTITDNNSTAYYLEAATSDQGTSIRWSTAEGLPYAVVSNDANATAIGTGRKNTALIIAGDPFTTYNHAALLCKNYTGGSKTDWFLPSKDELNELYKQRSIFGITSGYYWSSSQDSHDEAWTQYFGSGSQHNHNKNNHGSVRAVRAF